MPVFNNGSGFGLPKDKNPLVTSPFVQASVFGSNNPPPPGTNLRITDDGSFRTVDSGEFRKID